jgi:hypothetical protein
MIGSLTVLSACTISPDQPAAAALQQHVTHDGVAYLTDVAPGVPGMMLTSAGAGPTRGMTVSVWRNVAGLGYDQGAVAKAVARQTCEQQGGAFNAAALGRFAGDGEWRFAGACA